MPDKYTNDRDTALTGLELLTLSAALACIAAQLLFGRDHILCVLLRDFYAAAIVYTAGIYTFRHRNSPLFFLKRACIYTILFVFFGMFTLFLIDRKTPFRSLIELITLIKIPALSELFFTAAVLFFCCALISLHADRLFRKKHILYLLGAAGLLMAYFPSSVFGYPIIGVFTGCDTYDCIALLPYLGYFIAGMYSEKAAVRFSGRTCVVCGAATFCAAAASLSAFLTPVVSIVFYALPVYIAYLFCMHCRLYIRVVRWFLHLKDLLIGYLTYLYRNFMQSRKKFLPLYFIVYAGVFCIMAFCVFLPFFEYDNSIAWLDDAIKQYIPRAYYYMDYIRECVSLILKGNFDFPSYTFRSGLGNAVTMSYEPVYWLFALFDSSHIEFAYNFMTIFRYFLTGLSASVFFLYHKKGYFESLLGSILYTFCGFALAAGVRHAHFLAPMIFLPLLMLATEEIFRRKRWYLCTIFVALALPANYYFIYMSTIAMGLYYVLRFLFTKDREKKTWKNFFRTSCTFAGSYLLGVLIGNISLFTSFASFINSGRSGNRSLSALSFFAYKNSWLTSFFTYFISAPKNPGKWLLLGFVPLSYIAAVILFLKKKRKFLKSLCITALIIGIFPLGGFIFSGFSAITNRWSYILALLASYVTVTAVPELKNLNRRELRILSAAMIPYMMIILMDRNYRTEFTLCSLAVLLGTYILILCMNRNIRLIGMDAARLSLVLLCCASLILNAHYQYSVGSRTMSKNFAKQGEVLNTITNTPLKVFDNYPDKSFYRVASTTTGKSMSASLVMNYNSLTTFSSTLNGAIFNYNTAMANTAWNIIQLKGFDNRAYLNALAAVKYYSADIEDDPYIPYGYKKIDTCEKDGSAYYIYENDYALSLGYTYDSVLSEDELMQYSPPERQEIMLQAAAVDEPEKCGISSGTDSPSSSAVKINISDCTANGLQIEGNTATVLYPGATLSLSFDALDDSETYLVYNGICNPGSNNSGDIVGLDISCGSCVNSYDFRSVNQTYNTDQETFLFNLGYHKDAVNSCTITFNGTGSFTFDSLEVYCQPMKNYASQIRKLSENTLENVRRSGNTITGDISVDKNKLLVLSIPYQNGWTAYIDGRETDIRRANLMYMGLSLTPGDHEIRLVFRRPGIRISLALSACGTVIFIIALIIRRRRIKMIS